MLFIIAPIFLVILVGYFYGRQQPDSGGADRLINDYVLYVALPALLFIAVARADVSELKQWGFIASTLGGIAATWIIAGVIARKSGVGLPQASMLSMGAAYGTTGYLGVPILISAYGPQAALPAALATILHNIPAIAAVVISWDIFTKGGATGRVSLRNSIVSALFIVIKNPLTLAVSAGLAFSLFHLPVPAFLDAFARFLGNAAGPTALFALGLGLARLNVREHLNIAAGKIVVPMVVLKLVVQPAITLAIAVMIFHPGEEQAIWLATAVVMAAQPVGAGVYVFAKKYRFQPQAIALAIVISLPLALLTIPLLLGQLAGRG